VVRTVGGRRGMPESEIKCILGTKEADVGRKTAIYVRVFLTAKSRR